MKTRTLIWSLSILFIICLYATSAGAVDNTQWQQFMRAGMVAAQQGQDSEAEHNFLSAVKEAENFGPQDVRLAKSLNNLANIYLRQKKFKEAESSFKQALEITQKVYGINHPEVTYVSQNLAGVYAKQHKNVEAEQLYKRSLEINEKALDPNDPEIAKALLNLAIFLDNSGKYAESAPLYKQSLTIYEKTSGPNDPIIIAVKKNYANVLRKLN